MRALEDSSSDFPARSWPHHMGWARVPSAVWALDWRYPLPPQGLHISEGQTEPRGPSLDCQRDVYSRTRRHPRAGPPCLTPWTLPGEAYRRQILGVGPGPCPPSQLVGGVRLCLVNGLDTLPTVSCPLSSLPVPTPFTRPPTQFLPNKQGWLSGNWETSRPLLRSPGIWSPSHWVETAASRATAESPGEGWVQGLRQTPAAAAGGPSRRGGFWDAGSARAAGFAEGTGREAPPGRCFPPALSGLSHPWITPTGRHLHGADEVSAAKAQREEGLWRGGCSSTATTPRGGGPGGWLPRLDSSPPP